MTDRPARISTDELLYHQSVIAALRGSDTLRASWLGHLAQKYQLAPGDQVASDGAIVRVEQHAGGDMPIIDIDNTSEKVYFITGTLTTTAVPLGANTQTLTELVIQADPNNAVDILIGDANSQGWRLIAGAEWSCPIRNPGLIYGKAASSTATYSLFGRYGN